MMFFEMDYPSAQKCLCFNVTSVELMEVV
jgi:hypothetical protein